MFLLSYSACGSHRPECISDMSSFSCYCFFFLSSRRRHTRCSRDWSSDVCSSDLRRPGIPSVQYTDSLTSSNQWNDLTSTNGEGSLATVAVNDTNLSPSRRFYRLARQRSEERRVGKECRSRWAPDH